MEIRKHFDLLGKRVRDRVTKLEGVVTFSPAADGKKGPAEKPTNMKA